MKSRQKVHLHFKMLSLTCWALLLFLLCPVLQSSTQFIIYICCFLKKKIVVPSSSNIRNFYVYLIAKFSKVFPESEMAKAQENWKSESWVKFFRKLRKSSRNDAFCSSSSKFAILVFHPLPILKSYTKARQLKFVSQ